LNDIFKKISLILVSSSILITFFFSIFLIIYAAGWNYIIIPTYNISVNSLNESGFINEYQIEEAQKVLEALPKIYEYNDLIFLFVFSFIALGLPMLAYNAKREGYGSLFGMLTFGNMALLFFTGFAIEISSWIFENLVEKVIPTLANTMPLYSLYIDKAGVINAIIFSICVFLNFIDFEQMNFFGKKKNPEDTTSTNESFNTGGEIV